MPARLLEIYQHQILDALPDDCSIEEPLGRVDEGTTFGPHLAFELPRIIKYLKIYFDECYLRFSSNPDGQNQWLVKFDSTYNQINLNQTHTSLRYIIYLDEHDQLVDPLSNPIKILLSDLQLALNKELKEYKKHLKAVKRIIWRMGYVDKRTIELEKDLKKPLLKGVTATAKRVKFKEGGFKIEVNREAAYFGDSWTLRLSSEPEREFFHRLLNPTDFYYDIKRIPPDDREAPPLIEEHLDKMDAAPPLDVICSIKQGQPLLQPELALYTKENPCLLKSGEHRYNAWRKGKTVFIQSKIKQIENENSPKNTLILETTRTETGQLLVTKCLLDGLSDQSLYCLFYEIDKTLDHEPLNDVEIGHFYNEIRTLLLPDSTSRDKARQAALNGMMYFAWFEGDQLCIQNVVQYDSFKPEEVDFVDFPIPTEGGVSRSEVGKQKFLTLEVTENTIDLRMNGLCCANQDVRNRWIKSFYEHLTFWIANTSQNLHMTEQKEQTITTSEILKIRTTLQDNLTLFVQPFPYYFDCEGEVFAAWYNSNSDLLNVQRLADYKANTNQNKIGIRNGICGVESMVYDGRTSQQVRHAEQRGIWLKALGECVEQQKPSLELEKPVTFQFKKSSWAAFLRLLQKQTEYIAHEIDIDDPTKEYRAWKGVEDDSGYSIIFMQPERDYQASEQNAFIEAKNQITITINANFEVVAVRVGERDNGLIVPADWAMRLKAIFRQSFIAAEDYSIERNYYQNSLKIKVSSESLVFYPDYH